MSYTVNPKELQAVTSLPARKRYQYFLNKIADGQELWGIGDEEGWSFMANDDGREGMPVWPAEAYARLCCRDEWSDRSPKAISLIDWRNKWLPGLEADNRYVAVFPLASKLVIQVAPSQLALDLDVAMEQYE
jgi:hypothetical protein